MDNSRVQIQNSGLMRLTILSPLLIFGCTHCVAQLTLCYHLVWMQALFGMSKMDQMPTGAYQLDLNKTRYTNVHLFFLQNPSEQTDRHALRLCFYPSHICVWLFWNAHCNITWCNCLWNICRFSHGFTDYVGIVSEWNNSHQVSLW